MRMALVVALWAMAIGAAFWCFLKGGRAGGGCGGCGGGCSASDEEDDDDLRAEVLDIKDTGPGEDSGLRTRVAMGQVWVGEFVHATFHAQWTPGRSKLPVVYGVNSPLQSRWDRSRSRPTAIPNTTLTSHEDT